MQERHTEQDYRALLIADTPIIDVRAPIEFEQGAMPAAINLPLMNNDERAAVGICYKQQGSDAALALGHKLVAGEIRQQRMDAWRAACLQNPHGILCCARGGQRSHIVQSWLHDAGIDYPLVEGGYKALRQTAIQATIELAQKPIVLIGGCTGSGKTLLVQQQPNGVDLEGLARHRGSAFGRTLQPQLSQASFENMLAAEMYIIHRNTVNHHSRVLGLKTTYVHFGVTKTTTLLSCIDTRSRLQNFRKLLCSELLLDKDRVNCRYSYRCFTRNSNRRSDDNIIQHHCIGCHFYYAQIFSTTFLGDLLAEFLVTKVLDKQR